jgi:thiol-disulfide isomerase/thioredoxin
MPFPRRSVRWLPVLLAAALAVVATGPARAIAVGEPAPEITVVTADGKPVTLAGLKGKTVYVDFWASWCGPCRQSFPFMNAMHEKYGPRGLVIVGVNVDKKRADAEKFLARIPASFMIGYDEMGVTPAAYYVKKMPTSVLIDASGKIAAMHAGFTNESRDEVESRIRAALQK